ncbi:MAG: polyhydroxyalkanoic acid system family protein [Chloroflexi bacterium]|nr:polyhydroxyalkanoic acid system family protein [Chloroflexota bacterium]
MKVSRPHHLSKEAARAKVQDVLPVLMRQYGSSASQVDASWEGDAMRFSFRAVGHRFQGILEATESHVVLDMAVPLPLRSFEGAIRARIGQTLEELFRPG